MRNLNILYIFIAILLFSCNGSEPDSPYVYEANPHYSFGYIQFYGLFYKNVGNPNNILTISLFSDSLYISEEGSLEGFGQFLYLEDVYNSPTDTLLHTTTYTVNESRDPYTISAGKNDTIDNEVYTIGATISYYEQNTAKSTIKLITDGTLTVNYIGAVYNIIFDFKTEDGKDLKGSFTDLLPYFDESLQPADLKVRKKLLQKPCQIRTGY